MDCPLTCRCFSLVVLLTALLASPTGAQDLAPAERAKLAPEFQRMLAPDAPSPAEKRTDAKRAASSRLRSVSRTPQGDPVYGAYIFSRSASALNVRGLTITSTFSDFVVARATPSALRTLAQSESVRRIAASSTLELQNDAVRAETGAAPLNAGAVNNTAYTGEGVLACVIDSGIDPSHPDFTGPEGNTRVRFIWDQLDDSTSTPSPAERDPSRFGPDFNPSYGSEFTASDVEAGAVTQKDLVGHGTHVTGTLASSGRAFGASPATKRFQGVAPGVGIIAVKSGNEAPVTTNVLDGIRYCRRVAESMGKPVVVNMSLGNQQAPHTGSGLFARGVAQATDGGSASGTVVVAAAGNDGNPSDPIHVSGTLAPDDSTTFRHTVVHGDTTSASGDDAYLTSLWTYERNTYRLSVYSPGQRDTLTVRVQPDSTTFVQRDTPSGSIVIGTEPQPFSNARGFVISVTDEGPAGAPADGTWTYRLHNEGTSANGGTTTPVHGWDLPPATTPSLSIGYERADNLSTIGTPALSRGAIAVGNYVHRRRFSNVDGAPIPLQDRFQRDRITPSSSRGPTVDGRQKPAVAAPGTATLSALSDDSDVPPPFVGDGGQHRFNLGTSMSSPATAGIAALLLQQDPTLTTDRVRDLLMNSARTDGVVHDRGALPNDAFGAGRVNALRAMARLLGGSARQTVLSYDDPWRRARGNLEPERVGGDGPDRLALRFTPPSDGRVSGAFVTVAANPSPIESAINLSDSLHVEIWSDDGTGQPETQVGQTVAVAPEKLTAFTPNYLNLLAADAQVEPGTDYHLVLEPKTDRDALMVAGESAGDTSGRSLAFDGTTWTGTGSDLVVRPVVSAASGVETTLPVELTAFRATADGSAARLTWTTASETNNTGFKVQHAPGPSGRGTESSGSWTTLGFVEGAGTTQASHTYRFRTDALAPGPHRFRLQQVDTDGSVHTSTVVRVTLQMEQALRLTAPAPNPVRQRATLAFGVREATATTVALFDVLGRRVATLYDGTPAAGRMHTVRLNTTDLPSGVYFVRLKADGRARTQKVTVVR